MSTYKLVDSDSLNADLALVADAVRDISGSVDTLSFPGGYVSAIEGIPIGIPGEIDSEAGMNALLNSSNIGKCYKFVGETTENYINGDIYIVEEGA